MNVTTPEQQVRAAQAARKVGGYSELLRLDSERRAASGPGRVVLDPDTRRFVFQRTQTAEG